MCLVSIDGQSGGGGLEVDLEAVLDGVAAESCAGAGREQRLVGSAGALGEPGFEHRPDGRRQWRSSRLASFADGVDVGAGAERDVLAVQGDQLGDPQAGLDREREHRVIAPAGPGGLVAGGEERVDLGFGEVGQQVLARCVWLGSRARARSCRRARGGAARGRRTASGSRRAGCCGSRSCCARSVSRWSRNAAISGASRSAMSSALGGVPVRSVGEAAAAAGRCGGRRRSCSGSRVAGRSACR